MVQQQMDDYDFQYVQLQELLTMETV